MIVVVSTEMIVDVVEVRTFNHLRVFTNLKDDEPYRKRRRSTSPSERRSHYEKDSYKGGYDRSRGEKSYHRNRYDKGGPGRSEHVDRIDSKSFSRYDTDYKKKSISFKEAGSMKKSRSRFREDSDDDGDKDGESLSRRLGGKHEDTDMETRVDQEASKPKEERYNGRRRSSRSPASHRSRSRSPENRYQSRHSKPSSRQPSARPPSKRSPSPPINPNQIKPTKERFSKVAFPVYDDQNPEPSQEKPESTEPLPPPPSTSPNSTNTPSEASNTQSLPNGRSKIKISLGGRRNADIPRGPSAYERGRGNRHRHSDIQRHGEYDRWNNKNYRDNNSRERRGRSRDSRDDFRDVQDRPSRAVPPENLERPESRLSHRSSDRTESRPNTPKHHASMQTYTDDQPDDPRRPTPTPPLPKIQYGVVEYAADSVYKRVSQIGEGTYGKVYKAINTQTQKMVALKRLRMEAERDGFPITAMREIKLLQGLRHPSIVSLLEMMVEKSQVYMVFEYLEHDLAGIFSHPTLTFNHGHIKYMFKQLVEGLAYMHRRGILHRDIKGSNILLSNSGSVKIADFGLARSVDLLNADALYTNRVITLWYRPPELLLGETKYNGSVDMWGLGCILAEFFVRKALFQGHDEIGQLKAIYSVLGTPIENGWPEAASLPWYQLVPPREPRASQFTAKLGDRIPTSAQKLIQRMLALNPKHRITADETLADEYFKEEPLEERPLQLENLREEWHDFEAKQRRRKRRDGKDEAQKVKITR